MFNNFIILITDKRKSDLHAKISDNNSSGEKIHQQENVQILLNEI